MTQKQLFLTFLLGQRRLLKPLYKLMPQMVELDSL